MTAAEADALIVEFAVTLNATRVLVVGSQAIHAFHPDPPIDVVAGSREVDCIPQPFEDFEKWYYYAHEKLGAYSEFDVKHNVYVDMVRPHVPKLPPRWADRAIERTLHAPDGRGIAVIYPELHDLIVTKLLANRPQDEAFLIGVLRLQQLSKQTLRERVQAVALQPGKEHLRNWALECVERVFAGQSQAP